MIRCDLCEWFTVASGLPGEHQYREHIKEEHIEEVDADIPEGMVQVKIRGEWVTLTPEEAREVTRHGGDE